MNKYTGNFDLALQIREEVLAKIYQGMYQKGTYMHYSVNVSERERAEIVIGAPEITLLPGPFPDKIERALVKSKFIYHIRDLSDPQSLGLCGTARVTARSTLNLYPQDPVLFSGPVYFTYNFAETTENDIVVAGVAPGDRIRVQKLLLKLVQGLRGSLKIPVPSIANAGSIGSLTFRFNEQNPGMPGVMTVGANFGSVVKGSKTELTQSFVQYHWALALSDTFVLQQINNQLRRMWGGKLPPPAGTSPVTIGTKEKCIIPDPFSDGCAISVRVTLKLERLDIKFQNGGIYFSGLLRETSDSFLVPDVTASFSARVELELDANHNLKTKVCQVNTELQEWYAQILDSLASGSLSSAVETAIRQALASGSQGGLSSLLTTKMLNDLTALSKSTGLQLTPTAFAVQLRPEAIIVQGRLEVPETSQPPVAGLEVLPAADPQTRRLFHAGKSWAPAGNITSYDWNFGDGTTLQTGGDQAKFMVEHYFSPGRYNVRLTITDNSGQTGAAEQMVDVCQLWLTRLPNDAWNIPEIHTPTPVQFRVFDSNGPLQGVTVTGSSPVWQASQVTNAQGEVSFVLDPANFEIYNPPRLIGNFMACAGLYFEASKTGYHSDRRWLGMGYNIPNPYDNDWVAYKRHLKEQLGWPVEIHRELTAEQVTNEHVNEVFTDVGLALDILTKITALAERGSTVLPVGVLLNVNPASENYSGRLVERLEEISTTLDKNLENTRQEIVTGRVEVRSGEAVTSGAS